ncbi:MAG TPA: hypothetical protein VKA27_18615 [Sunxiuqinia sp.]|nr:hypothetical protein [Sunxiuqinia sp.]
MKFLIFCLLVFISISLKAQENYQFKKIANNFPVINKCDHQDILGDTVAKKLEQFDQVYTKKVTCGPPAYHVSTEIEKPDLYYSIQKVTAYYRKCVKKETLPKEKIEKNMVDILNKCLLIYSQNTSHLEQELRSANNSKEILGIFSKIIIE